MHRCLEELHQDHLNLSRVLQVLEQQLDTLRDGGTVDLHVMGEIVEYVQSYPDLIHHRREDVIMQVYRERFPDASGVIDQVMDEHRVLRGRTLELKEALQQCWQDSPVPREHMAGLIAGYLRLQWDHMNLEEGEFYRLVEGGLTADDWARIDRSVPRYTDPLFGDLMRRGYDHIFSQVMAYAY
jgi:hemerythrin-like domain-containing protein